GGAGGGAACVPSGPELCGDGIDNDCNGSADCADPVCLNQRCGACRACLGTTCTCLPSTLVSYVDAGFQEIRTLSITGNHLTPQAAWVNVNVNNLSLSQCSANCGSY